MLLITREATKTASHRAARCAGARGLYARGGQRALSAALVLLSLPITLPLLLVGALLSCAAMGHCRPPLLRQQRAGRHGLPFTMLKFRSMREARDVFESWGRGDEGRITPLGHLLRATHLDELPQILNVLKGDMNLVGPRPELVEIQTWAESRIPDFAHRLAARPGLTGLAQLEIGYTGKDPEAYARKLEADLRYLRTRTLLLDLTLIARTPLTILHRVLRPR